MRIRKIKLDAGGNHLPADAKDHVAVLFPDHGNIIITSRPINDKPMSQPDLQKLAASFSLFGGEWDLLEVHETDLVLDRTRRNPACDTDYFDVPSDWMWTKTPWTDSDGRPSASGAWFVGFDDGDVNYLRRSGLGFALAVRRSGQ
jgi:hypothetical protein